MESNNTMRCILIIITSPGIGKIVGLAVGLMNECMIRQVSHTFVSLSLWTELDVQGERADPLS